jgi:hypothetical protein
VSAEACAGEAFVEATRRVLEHRHDIDGVDDEGRPIIKDEPVELHELLALV